MLQWERNLRIELLVESRGICEAVKLDKSNAGAYRHFVSH
jgi:hypothetical protein